MKKELENMQRMIDAQMTPEKLRGNKSMFFVSGRVMHAVKVAYKNGDERIERICAPKSECAYSFLGYPIGKMIKFNYERFIGFEKRAKRDKIKRLK